MLKNIFFLSLLLAGSTIASASCISDEEYKRVLAGLPSKGDFYSDVPNMVNCKVKSELSDLVCSDPKLKNAMLLLSIGFIYAYENATHTPVADYTTYNNDFEGWLNDFVKTEKNKDVALRKLCYIIKVETWISFGNGEYYDPILMEVISSKLNDNGVVVDALNEIIYLGKSCDAVVSGEERIKRIWYNDGDQFVIAQPDKDGKFEEKYRFNHDDNVAQLNCQKPTN
jgi:hypothetical protein